VKKVLSVCASIHSVDSLSLLETIDKEARSQEVVIPIYFQINVDAESTKGGFLANDLGSVSEKFRELLNAGSPLVGAGLMTIPAIDQSPIPAFEKMKDLSAQYGSVLGAGLSMGMSSDYIEAIENGSTVIRVGTALFGSRPKT